MVYLCLVSYNTPFSKNNGNRNERFSIVKYHVNEKRISFVVYNNDLPMYVANKYKEVFLFHDSAVLQPNPGFYDTYHYDVPEMKILKANSEDTGSFAFPALPVKYDYFIRAYTMDFKKYAEENKLSPTLGEFIEFEKTHSVLIPGDLWIK